MDSMDWCSMFLIGQKQWQSENRPKILQWWWSVIQSRLESEVWHHRCSKHFICLSWFMQISHFQSFQTSRKISDDAQKNASCTQTYSRVKLIAVCIYPWMAKRKQDTSCPVWAQPGNISVNGPSVADFKIYVHVLWLRAINHAFRWRLVGGSIKLDWPLLAGISMVLHKPWAGPRCWQVHCWCSAGGWASRRILGRCTACFSWAWYRYFFFVELNA